MSEGYAPHQFYCTIDQWFHWIQTPGLSQKPLSRERAFEICVEMYREQYGVDPKEFIEYYNALPKEES